MLVRVLEVPTVKILIRIDRRAVKKALLSHGQLLCRCQSLLFCVRLLVVPGAAFHIPEEGLREGFTLDAPEEFQMQR